MANKLIYSFANPLQLFSTTPGTDDRYLSKDFEDYNFPDTVLPWESYVKGYCQPWMLDDVIALQLQTNVGPVNFILKDCETDAVIDTVQLDQKQQSLNEPDLFIYELNMPLSGYDPGCYYGVVEFGFPVVFSLRTGELNFEETQPNTLLFEYKNFEAREGLIFEKGFFPSIRVQATKKFLGSKTKSTSYEDQVLNLTMLKSKKYRVWDLVIGGTYGIPDYMQDILASVVTCSTFLIDGKAYTISEGKDFEPNVLDGYPMKGWSIEVREKFARDSRFYENDDPIDAAVAVMINVDSKGFGNSNTGSQTIITDVQ